MAATWGWVGLVLVFLSAVEGGGKKPPRARGFAKKAAAPSTAPADASFAKLRPWLEARGAKISAVDVTTTPLGVRGVVATRDFARGEEIFVIPRDTCILDEERADKSPVGRVWADAAGDVPACVRVGLLVLFLDATDDTWRPALGMLPSRADFDADGGPMELWSPAEVAACDCGQLQREVARRQESLRQLYDEVIGPGWRAAAAADATSALARVPVPSFERVQWATVATTSRAYGEGEAGAGRSSMLVPGVDLCNHDCPERANTVKGLSPWGQFVVLASQDISSGEEVFISYGNMPNRLLLQQFGFMLDRAVATDVAVVEVDEDVRQRLPADATGLLRDAGGAAAKWQPCGSNLKGATGAADYERLLRTQLERLAPQPAGGSGSGPRARLASNFRALSRRLLEEELARTLEGPTPSRGP